MSVRKEQHNKTKSPMHEATVCHGKACYQEAAVCVIRITLIIVILSFHSYVFACDEWVARVVSFNGSVTVAGPDNSVDRVGVDALICPGYKLIIGQNSRAALYLSNNTFVRLDQNSVLAFPNKNNDDGFWVGLKQGVGHFISRITKRFEVETAFVNASVDGTEFLVSVDANQSSISVVEGRVTAAGDNTLPAQAVTSGQMIVAKSDYSPYQVTRVQATDRVDWAIFYPPLFALNQLEDRKAQPALEQASAQLKDQRPDLALAILGAADQSLDSIRVATAAVQLSVGRVNSAAQTLFDLKTADALALQSVLLSASNKVAEATQTAQQAIKQDPHSAAAFIAQSYALQSALDLPAALNSAQQAANLAPNSSLAWSRLSELQLAIGDLTNAKMSAEQAHQLDPHSPQALNRLAFLSLFNLNFKMAQTQFEQSLKLNSENPDAHLGLGLALLRQGNTGAGRVELEIATSLDPARSVLRSYLGRAYFEEKRDADASVQWNLAKQFDPLDPTPYFYEGVRQLYANNPVAAIDELETSQELNDKRALYRSDTLLDSDAASRSATLARAYDDAGYDQGVLLAARDALKQDPSSSEGHRLLADHYRGDSRYESARASELLQSQLWQPLSAYPLQPQLSESNISFVEGAGPQTAGLNEYHSLFTQDGIYASLDGYGGGDGTWSEDVTGSFLAGPLAVSLGQFHFESDGWRPNSWQEQDILNGLVQWQLSPSTSFQFEASTLDWDQGDLSPHFSQPLVNVTGQVIEQDTYRVGMRHKFNADLAMIVSGVQQDRVDDQALEVPFSAIDSELTTEAASMEVQFIQKARAMNFIYGVGSTQYEVSNSIGNVIEIPDVNVPGFSNRILADNSILNKPEQYNAYFYMLGDWFDSVDLEAGLSFISVDQKYNTSTNQSMQLVDTNGNVIFDSGPGIPQLSQVEIDETVWLPKIGFSFDLTDLLQLRMAYYRTYKGYYAAEQSIEPTTFLGFYQVFSESTGSEGENLSVGLDRRYSDTLSYGISYINRDINLDIPSDVSGIPDTYSSDEDIADAYFQYIPSKQLSISLNLIWDRRSTIEVSSALAPLKVDRYSAPIEIKFYSNNGTTFKVTQTYYKQQLSNFIASDNQEKSTWVTGIAAGYRFPRHFGAMEFGVVNLFNEEAEYVNNDASTLAFYPGRIWFTAFNINL